MLDIILIGFVIHYCEDTYHLSKIYLMISINGTIIRLIINLIFFLGSIFPLRCQSSPAFKYSISSHIFYITFNIFIKRNIIFFSKNQSVLGCLEFPEFSLFLADLEFLPLVQNAQNQKIVFAIIIYLRKKKIWMN